MDWNSFRKPLYKCIAIAKYSFLSLYYNKLNKFTQSLQHAGLLTISVCYELIHCLCSLMGQIMESGTVGDDYKYYTVSQLPSCILGLLLLRWINFIYVYYIIGYVNKIFGVLHMDLLLAPQSVELMYRCALLYFWMSQSLLLVKDNYFRYLMYNY